MREGGEVLPAGVRYTSPGAGVDHLQDLVAATEGGAEVLVTTTTELEPTLVT